MISTGLQRDPRRIQTLQKVSNESEWMKHSSVGKRVRVLSRGFQVELEEPVPDGSSILEPEGVSRSPEESRRNLENPGEPWKTLAGLRSVRVLR